MLYVEGFEVLGIDDLLVLVVISVFMADGTDQLVIEKLVDGDGLASHEHEFDDGWDWDVDGFGKLSDRKRFGVDEDTAVDLGEILFFLWAGLEVGLTETVVVFVLATLLVIELRFFFFFFLF